MEGPWGTFMKVLDVLLRQEELQQKDFGLHPAPISQPWKLRFSLEGTIMTSRVLKEPKATGVTLGHLKKAFDVLLAIKTSRRRIFISPFPTSMVGESTWKEP